MLNSAGKFIVIEGLEGSGKSTVVKTVIDALAKLNIEAVSTREPGGTDIGELLRTVIKNPDYQTVLDDKCELLLLYAARVQLIEQVIKPCLQRGCWVVADRFELSTLAYQSGGRGLDEEFISTLSSFCLNGLKPDLTLYLDITPELGMQRARARGQFDRIEQQSMAFFHKVHSAYIKHCTADAKIVMVDATRDLEQVQSAIQQAVSEFIAQQSL
ncbi:MAG: dTMP kinase [Legionellales bacterium]